MHYKRCLRITKRNQRDKKLYIKEFLKNLTISVRKRETVYWILPLCSLTYGIMSEQSLFYLILILFVLMLGLIAFDGISFLKNNVSRKKPHAIDIPELRKLANKIGLELSPQPFWEIENKKMKAMSLGDSKKSKRIIFGKDFLASLTNEEKIFVGGHEFFHLYGHEFLYYPIIFVPILGSVVLLQLTLNIPQIIMIPGFLGATVGCLCFGKRSFESIADINGAINVSREDAINALKKANIGKEEKSFNLHPSLKARIKNLDSYYQQQK